MYTIFIGTVYLGFLLLQTQDASSANTTFTMFLLHNEPYAIKGLNLGIVSDQMNLLMRKNRDINIKTRIVSWSLQEAKAIVASADPLEMIREKENITDRNFIIGAWGYHYREENHKFVTFPVVHSQGLLVIVHRDTISLTVKLFYGMVQCALLIYCGFLIAASVGIVIWCVENRSNDVFKEALWEGVLNGIWYGVVTMTSVGYGDVVPKSKISKILAIVFMLLSTLMVASLTSTFTDHLTHMEFDIANIHLSVVDGSRGMHVTQLYKRYKDGVSIHIVPTFYDALHQVKSKEVDATIIDANVASWCRNIVFKKQLRFTKKIDQEFDVSIFIYQEDSNKNDVEKLLEQLNEFKHDFEMVVDDYVQPIELVVVDTPDFGYAMNRLGLPLVLSFVVAMVILFVLAKHLFELVKQRKKVNADILLDHSVLLHQHRVTLTQKHPTLEDLQQRLDTQLNTIREDILEGYRDILKSHETSVDDMSKVDNSSKTDVACEEDDRGTPIVIPSLDFGSGVNCASGCYKHNDTIM